MQREFFSLLLRAQREPNGKTVCMRGNRLCCTAIVLLAFALGMSPSFAVAEESWAIAIHGGAGGNPAQWTPAQREARLAGIQEVLELGKEMLSTGRSSLDTVETVVRKLEDNPAFNAGKGAVLTSEGRAELDASIMDGSTLACGAVGSVTILRHPISLARRVMSETKHVLLVGPGAEQFGRAQQLEIVDPNFFLLTPDEKDVSVVMGSGDQYLGTVGCVALDRDGNLAAGTSTGGLQGKMPGRLGDTPVIGAGTYANNQTCAVSCTGTGEEYIRHAVAFNISAQMQYAGKSLGAAVNQIMTGTLRPGMGGVIAVGADGSIAVQHNTPGMTCGTADHHGQFEVVLEVTKP